MEYKQAFNTLRTNKENIMREKLATCANALDYDLRHIYKDKFLADVNMKTRTNVFPAHKLVLCARSPVFTLMFSNDMRESSSDVIEVDDLDDDTVQQLLLFLYTDQLENLQWEAATKLYYAADKYQIEKLKLMCSSFLVDNLSTSTVPELLVLADKHSDSDLLKAVEDVILDHEEQVFSSNEWGKLIETNPQLAAQTMHMKYKKKPTAEQLRIAQIRNDANKGDYTDLKDKVKRIIKLTGKTSAAALVALHDCDNDLNRAAIMLLEGNQDENKMQIFVETWLKIITLEVEPSVTIELVKVFISQRDCIPPDLQKLFFNCRELKDGCTLSDYDIPEKSLLQLVIRNEDFMTIFVKTIHGKTLVLLAKPTDTIESVKAKIGAKDPDYRLPPRDLYLIYDGKRREDLLTLWCCNIKDKSILHLVPSLRG